MEPAKLEKYGTTVYLCGKMSGEPYHNFPLFDKIAKQLRSEGYNVISPSELDDQIVRDWAMKSEDGKLDPNGQTWAQFLARDIQIVADEVDAVVVIPGWTRSRGARLECYVAKLCGKPIYKLNGRKVSKIRLAIAWQFGI